MINLILITFILTFLMDRFQRFISRKLKVNRKIVIACLYIILVSFIGTTLYKYLPVLTIQISQLIYQFKLFFQNPPDNEIVKYVLSTINGMEVSKYIEQGVDVIYQSIANIGKVSLQILLSLILSLFFLLEKERIITFTSKFKDSKLKIFYEEIAYFGERFARSFGKVIEAQFFNCRCKLYSYCHCINCFRISTATCISCYGFLTRVDSCCRCDYFFVSTLYHCLQRRRSYVRSIHTRVHNSNPRS